MEDTVRRERERELRENIETQGERAREGERRESNREKVLQVFA